MNKENLQKMVDEGYISVQKHPVAELYIYNYTPRAQFERVWNDETMTCRGLIMDGQGRIVARPFKKFFNIEEHQGNLPDGKFEVYDKLDGSLGILYWIEGRPFIATRGSFTSEQSQVATKMLYEMQQYWFWLNPNYTYLFEIIYPENRIVIDYKGKKDLVLLAVVDTQTGGELSLEGTPFAYVQRYDGIKDLAILKELERENSEGFVIKWENGFRLKFKFEEYKRLHRLVTQVNARIIWDLLRNNQPFDELLERVPDEFYQWVKNTKNQLLDDFENILHCGEKAWQAAKDLPTRKDQALKIKEFQYPGVAFALLDGEDPSDIIWRMLRPKAERPFKQDEV